MKKLILLTTFLVFVGAVRGQHAEQALQDRLQNLLEQVLEDDENSDVEQLINDLVQLADSPIPINRAVEADFEPLFFLNPIQLKALLTYRDQHGPVLSQYELASVDGFDEVLAELTGMFLNFETEPPVAKYFRVRQELLLRATRLLEQQAAFKTGKFEGSQEKLYSRYRFTGKDIQFGVTAEKDAGESFFAKSNSAGFDFYSGFARLQFQRGSSSVVLGDYVVQFGQGLVAWQGFAMGKSADVDRIARFNQGIKPYSSTDENNFMRGAGADIRFGSFRLQPFVSYKAFDANTDSVNGELLFTSMQTSGLHRTESEIEDKNSVHALVGGAHLGFQTGNLQLGLTGMHTRYEFPLQRADALYNRYLFAGEQISNFGINYRYALNRLYLFGETAHADGALATVNGVMFQPVGQLAFSALYRNIAKQYNTPIGAAFTENSRVNDEQGLFFGIRALPAAGLTINAYADFFEYKWIKYTTAAPGKGQELMCRADYNLNRSWRLYVRYFYERKPLKISSEKLRYNQDQVRQGLRAQLDGELNSQFSIRTRLEHSFYEHDHNSDGFLVSQDLAYHHVNNRSKMWIRLAYFDTDDYDARIYAYENDLLYQFSIPAFYGEGLRAYVNGKVKICEKVELWLKCARTWFFGVDTLGSGNTAIDGSTRSELKLQLRFKI
ncbi:hypothetical protein [Mangrovibacterium marinum]|uniref:Helix-hairpin-helix protein n=1 Tax=Mangrovibacterium marinum TaxID=1639118 RepID=A0A2T5BYB1_9BACT|nr:hypothetical protein [Mangrovibacterium marinum]PTN07226.1 hypothetical protein C8N47_12011 [Mangrovibacterium marinum]